MPVINDYQTEEGLWVGSKGDEGVREQQKEYKAIIEFFKERQCNYVWDIGAHVGWFPWYVNKSLKTKPKKILCVECAPKQLRYLNKNAPDNVQVISGAVVPDSYQESTINLWLGKTYTSCDSVIERRGRQAVTVNVVKMNQLRKYVPNPDLIKLDCEGAEYGIEPVKHIPSSVKIIVAELHYDRPGQIDQLEQFEKSLSKIGLVPIKETKLSTFRKTTHATYIRQ